MDELLPNKSSSESKRLDQKSISLIRNLLIDYHIDISELQEGGTLPNIDGYLSILGEDDRIAGKVTVQVKHLTYPTFNQDTYYDIPQSLLAYAMNMRGEIVIFLTCDIENKIVYWKYIDFAFIDECKSKSDHIQHTYRYHFKLHESFSANNVKDLLSKWKDIYDERMSSIKDEKTKLNEFISVQKLAFNRVSTLFYGIKDSHIHRKETDELFNWITSELNKDTPRLMLLVGSAGIGKSVVIKDLIKKLDAFQITNLSIKADCSNVTDDDKGSFSLQTLQSMIRSLSLEHDKVVLIIDQIDALSQYLSNDRDKLNNLLNVIATMCDETMKDIRIIVSCRKYDLEYDAVLKSLKASSSSIKLSGLSTDEVKFVISKLHSSLPDALSQQTIKLLCTPQHLDLFCRIYKEGRIDYNYHNYIELYDELWNNKILYAPDQIHRDNLEHFLFEIANHIHLSDTLTPTLLKTADNCTNIKYLASEGLIRYESNRISFFHQSFYDYTLARYYVKCNKSFLSDISNNFQGLELRSNVKLFLDFEKGHSDKLYKRDIRSIIFSDKIRLHLKQLALSILSSCDNPKGYEYKIIRGLPEYNNQLFAYFISATSSKAWFPTIKNLVTPLLDSLSIHSEMFYPILNCFSYYVFSFPKDIYSMTNSICDEETRGNIARWLLNCHNDYSCDLVIQWYNLLKDKNKHYSANFVVDSIQTNLLFALAETKNILLDYLLNCINDNDGNHDKYSFPEGLCEKLYDNNPKEFLLILLDCFIKATSDKTKSYSYDWYKSNTVFNTNPNRITDKLFNWLSDLLVRFAKEESFIKPIVSSLLMLNDEMALVLAFRTMSANPQAFTTQIREIVSDSAAIDKYLEGGDFKYYFLEMLKSWHLTLNKDDSEWYQNILLGFQSSTDLLDNRERRYSDLLYSHLWYRKWTLICSTLPTNNLHPSLIMLISS